MPHRFLALLGCDLLSWARHRAGLSIRDAAHRVGVSPVALKRWEIGAARPTLDELRRLAAAYDSRISVFFLKEPPLGLAGECGLRPAVTVDCRCHAL